MMTYAGVQMLMDKLNHLIHSNHIPSINNNTIIRIRPQLQILYQMLDNPMFQTLFFHKHQHLQKVTDLKKKFTDAVQEAHYIVDLFLSGILLRYNRYFTISEDFNRTLNFDDVRTSIEYVKVELTTMTLDNMTLDSSQNQSAAASISFPRNSQGSKKLLDEFVVGLDRDLELIRDKLVEDQRKVDVVSVVGMGGIGKTTLATKVFNDHYVKHHFYVRVWVTVSQTYDKRDVLIQILESIRVQLDLEKDNSDSRLREMVHKHLMGKRYLIVIDDIWHTETWDNLKLLFPHDNTGSRILLTTRLAKVAKHANSHGLIHHVAHLKKETSWELLCQKVFHGDDYPEWSIKPGMQIVESCQGLPLAVAVISGVLAKEARNEKFWVEIAESTGSYIVSGQNGCLETLGLSYNHLPHHLRECFLYLGGFPEDYRFEVRKLIWLWMAEGFIEEEGNRSLEGIAKGYLMDLIDRNLVIVAQRSRSNGVVKACKVHDLVRELCMKKANEEQFFTQCPNDITTPPYKSARMFMNKDIYIQDFPYRSVKNLRAILCFSELRSLGDDIARCFRSFVLLRVLDLSKCRLNGFPDDMELLVHLRYLAIWSESAGFPSSICTLWNLQTLIYTSSYGDTITLPRSISDLVNLRHLSSKSGSVVFLTSIDRPMKLQTILGVRLRYGVHSLQKCFPCIKELKFNTYPNKYYDFKSLTHLEKLNINGRVGNKITFPATLNTLTLEGCYLPWSDMSVIQSLPNLQVLKLKSDAFEGSCWNTNEQEFPQLKFLRLDDLDINQWEAYSTSFPCLRQLEIMYCKDLEEIPLEIGEIPTLELIKIDHSRLSVGESVRRIQEEQHDFGNYDLNIDIGDSDNDSDDLSDEE